MDQLPLMTYGTPHQKVVRALQLCDRLEVSGDSRADLEALYRILEELEVLHGEDDT